MVSILPFESTVLCENGLSNFCELHSYHWDCTFFIQLRMSLLLGFYVVVLYFNVFCLGVCIKIDLKLWNSCFCTLIWDHNLFRCLKWIVILFVSILIVFCFIIQEWMLKWLMVSIIYAMKNLTLQMVQLQIRYAYLVMLTNAWLGAQNLFWPPKVNKPPPCFP